MEVSKVKILMSTYNGGRYLEEQLESLYKQKNVEIELLVRDDGSTDNTVDILDAWGSKIPMRVLQGENCGPAASFLELIKETPLDAEFYAFCDQDDWWYPEKLSRAIGCLSGKYREGKPLLYCSATILADSDLHPVGQSGPPSKKVSFGNALVENVAIGCTVVVTKPLIKKIREKRFDVADIIMHDWWALLVCSAYGDVIFDSDPNILYRQHDLNDIGYQRGIEFWLSRMKRFTLGEQSGKLSRQVNHFYELYKEDLPSKCSSLIEQCFHSEQGVASAVRCVRESSVYRQRRIDNWILRLLYFMKKV